MISVDEAWCSISVGYEEVYKYVPIIIWMEQDAKIVVRHPDFRCEVR